jgi:IPT/TIG domain
MVLSVREVLLSNRSDEVPMMKRLSLFLVLVLLTLAAQAADPPEILSIEPPNAPTTGGWRVTILGRNLDLPPGFACIVPCPPRVQFGETEVEAVEHTNERLVVPVPPHAAGKVDVTVITGDGRKGLKPGAFTYTQSGEDGWEKILIPIYFEKPLPGGAGSVWETQFRLRADAPVSLAPYYCDPATPCPPIYPAQYSMRAGETLTKAPRAPEGTEGRGRLIFVSKHAAKDVSLQVRIADLSRGRVDAGTDIPVVRQNQLRSSTVQLLNVPHDAAFRYRLRIYETANIPTSFRVRVYNEGVSANPGPLFELIAVTSSPEVQPEFRFQPFYFETDLGTLLQPFGGVAAFRVEVTPLASFSQAWSLLTITSVETNHVTIVAPQ